MHSSCVYDFSCWYKVRNEWMAISKSQKLSLVVENKKKLNHILETMDTWDVPTCVYYGVDQI